MDVAWDGHSVWVVTREKGISIWNENGVVIGRIGESGRPAARAIAARCCVPSNRAMSWPPVRWGSTHAPGAPWSTFADERPEVNVFHTARRVISRGDDPDEYASDTGIVFQPHWIHEYDDGVDDGKRRVLIGRYAQTSEGKRRPLCIELPSLEVSVGEWDLTMADHLSSPSYASHNGDLLEAGDFQVTWLKAQGKTWPNGKSWRHACVPRNSGGVKNGGLRKVIVPYNGWLYVPGLMWFRIDPKTMREEKLTPGRLRPPHNGFATSASSGPPRDRRLATPWPLLPGRGVGVGRIIDTAGREARRRGTTMNGPIPVFWPMRVVQAALATTASAAAIVCVMAVRRPSVVVHQRDDSESGVGQGEDVERVVRQFFLCRCIVERAEDVFLVASSHAGELDVDCFGVQWS